MMEVIIFALKALVVVLSLGSLIALIALLAGRATQKSELEIEPLHKKHKDWADFLKSFTSSKEEMKEEKKRAKEEKKAEKKAHKNREKTSRKKIVGVDDDNDLPKNQVEPIDEKHIKKVFVLNFDGDMHAHQVSNLREEITAVLQTVTPLDEVVVKVESPGGVVHSYGLAASQLMRIRDRGIPLTICVDQVAASGGYLMACVANKIICAPFAIVGSIGVVAQVPNFFRVLKKHDVDYKEYTAGDYKRTVSLLGEITPQGEQKFQERLVDTHILFKNFVQRFRPHVDIARVATGEYWFGEEALKLGLVDELRTSDDYLLSFEKDTPIYELNFEVKKTLSDKLSEILGQTLSKVLLRIWTRLETNRFL